MLPNCYKNETESEETDGQSGENVQKIHLYFTAAGGNIILYRQRRDEVMITRERADIEYRGIGGLWSRNLKNKTALC